MYNLKKDMKHEPKVELRGGKGTLDFEHVIPPEALYGSGSQFGVMTIPAGCSIGLHSHKENYEIYYILEGKAKVTDDDDEKILVAGDAEICGDGNTHSIENVGDTDLKMMAVIMWNPKYHKYE